jgi:hypothetical protein
MKKVIFLIVSFLYLVSAKCPENSRDALLPDADLLACNCQTLRKFYAEDDCCIVNLAECNNIEKAWEVSRNIINWKQLCPPIPKSPYFRKK